MRRFKRVFSAVMVLALMFSLSASALAAEYDLTIGDVAVSADASGQYVTQTNGVQNFKDETEIVITSNGVETSNTISIESSEEATAEVTISDVNIVVEDESAIYIKEGSDVVITVEGSNSVANTGEYMGALGDYAITKSAAVHVQDANLTIAGATGAEQDSLEVRAGTSFEHGGWCCHWL